MAAGMRSGMGIASLILIAGSLVLMFFVVLGGVKNATPLNKIYFLQADTSSIAGARPTSQWTFFYVCDANNMNCGAAVPDLPFGYAWIGGGTGAPSDLVGSFGKSTTSKYYYYIWRFGWPFYLIALFLNVMALFTSLLAPVSRLASGLSGIVLSIALFFFTLAAALMTTEFVKARNEFKSAGINAEIGKYAFGFTWGAWAAMFLAAIMLFLGCGFGGRSESSRTTRSTGGTGFFGRNRRRSGRGSFVDNDSQRRVKDEYA